MMSGRDLEAKIVVLGSQGVGKTSLLTRFIHNTFLPPSAQPPTIGATFLTKHITSSADHPATTIRLQIWDTAGQERFRSISKLYYRGANAAILCYDITDARSFADMGDWLRELREYNGAVGAAEEECVVHVVGTKADVVAEDPRRREVPFEKCITYVAEQLHGGGSTGLGPIQSTQAASLSSVNSMSTTSPTPAWTPGGAADPRNSGFWGQDTAWDSCHEISAKDGEGVEEVFRVIVRKLVEQQAARERRRVEEMVARTPAAESGGGGGYFEYPGVGEGKGSFRVGLGDKRRSWLGFPTAQGVGEAEAGFERRKGGRCC